MNHSATQPAIGTPKSAWRPSVVSVGSARKPRMRHPTLLSRHSADESERIRAETVCSPCSIFTADFLDWPFKRLAPWRRHPRFRAGYMVVLKDRPPSLPRTLLWPRFDSRSLIGRGPLPGGLGRFAEFRDCAHMAIPALIKSLRNEGGSCPSRLGGRRRRTRSLRPQWHWPGRAAAMAAESGRPHSSRSCDLVTLGPPAGSTASLGQFPVNSTRFPL